MNLCLELNGYQNVNDSSLYWTNYYFVDDIITDNNNQYLDDNSLNIIVPYRFTNYNNNLRGGALSTVFGAIAINSFEYNTGILVHEVGHELGLLHTHHPNPCEHVTRDPNDPNYNAECAGDRVVDTGAMPNLNNNTAFIDQNNCQYLGGLNDCEGTPFVLGDNEIKNYMSYTLQHCREVYTIGQGIRVREQIVNNQTSYNDFVSDAGFDLYSKNSEDDIGLEQDNVTNVIWDSPDIWVRNQPDGLTIQEHQNLEYIDDNTPVYVYVRVRNRSCSPSSGNDFLNLYWAKGGIGEQTWPDLWQGDNNPSNPNGLEIGNIIGSQTIPALAIGDEAILEFQWQPKNPDDYENAGFTNKPWMFCFLSRIISHDDPMSYPEVSNPVLNTRNNNNIVYKNTTTVNLSVKGKLGSILVGNTNLSQSLTTNINFFTNQDNMIWEEAEVRVSLSEDLWQSWQDSDARSTHVSILDESKREVSINRNYSSLDSIYFEPNEWQVLTPQINFLIKDVTGETYTLNISQTKSGTDEVLGGFTYYIKRDYSRQNFKAEAILYDDQNNTRLEVIDINEYATYNWYDEEGNYISTGTNLVIQNTNEKEYKLEVIADSDGHKDYETFTVKENRGILSISPNPTNNDFTVYYDTGSANTAFIKITNILTGTQDNYILDLSVDYKTINLSNRPIGQYTINLITDNVIVDAKNLIKN